MVETTMRFLVDFRERAEKESVEAALEMMSLGELLYQVLVGEERVQGWGALPLAE